MTTSPTAPDLDVLAGLLAEATPGPWFGSGGGLHVYGVTPGDEVVQCQRRTDAALVRAAVNALPALIAAARERDALVESLAPVIDYVREQEGAVVEDDTGHSVAAPSLRRRGLRRPIPRNPAQETS